MVCLRFNTSEPRNKMNAWKWFLCMALLCVLGCNSRTRDSQPGKSTPAPESPKLERPDAPPPVEPGAPPKPPQKESEEVTEGKRVARALKTLTGSVIDSYKRGDYLRSIKEGEILIKLSPEVGAVPIYEYVGSALVREKRRPADALKYLGIAEQHQGATYSISLEMGYANILLALESLRLGEHRAALECCRKAAEHGTAVKAFDDAPEGSADELLKIAEALTKRIREQPDPEHPADDASK